MAGEFALIERLLKQATPASAHQVGGLILGPGDDCALIAPPETGEVWAITTDMLVEGTHFLGTDNPEDLGWKTLAVNLSDLAAMGAQPRYVTLAASLLATDESSGWIDQFFRGFTACANEYGVSLIGGDTTRGPRSFSVTAMGVVKADQALLRSNACDLDDIWISGTPGLAALGLAHKLGSTILPAALIASASAALHRPQPRIALGLALAGLAHACLDVSDGLLQDLEHIAKASGLTASLQHAVFPATPSGISETLWQQCLLGGGDDYELLFTAAPDDRCKIESLSTRLALPLHRIGQMHTAGNVGTILLLDNHQKPVDLSGLRKGFDHFA
jgi:thiamine-monophosphate kinase